MQAVTHTQKSCVPLTYGLCALLHLRFWHKFTVSVNWLPSWCAETANNVPKVWWEAQSSWGSAPFLPPEMQSSFVRGKNPLPNALHLHISARAKFTSQISIYYWSSAGNLFSLKRAFAAGPPGLLRHSPVKGISLLVRPIRSSCFTSMGLLIMERIKPRLSLSQLFQHLTSEHVTQVGFLIHVQHSALLWMAARKRRATAGWVTTTTNENVLGVANHEPVTTSWEQRLRQLRSGDELGLLPLPPLHLFSFSSNLT